MASFWWVWPLVAIGFFLLYLRERMAQKSIQKNLAYINKKMKEFTDEKNPLTQQKLLVVTGEPELKELLHAINSLLDRARQSASDYAQTQRAMRRMLSNVSHDLKTPLTVIMGYAEVLNSDVNLSRSEQQRMLHQVYKKTTQVQELIHAFFDLSKLEADDYNLPLAIVDVSEVCRQGILVYFDLLSQKGMKVDVQLPQKPAWIYANEEALSRILDNLLSNAIRYGADGNYLGLSLKQVKDDYQIDVIDHGPGIKKVDQAKVFDRMYIMDDSRNRSIEGSGLGLTITKRLTERLGGSISLISIPAQRTCFTVTFPKSEFATSQNDTDKLRNK